jgi:hypothetical protein
MKFIALMSIIGYNKIIDRSPKLPPPDAWRFIPGKDEPLPTPLDERGLVDVDALIKLVNTTIEPECQWQPGQTVNIHHLYWEHNRYPATPNEAVNPHEFRSSSINQIVIPKTFHNWLHIVTKAPDIPTEEVMGYRIEAYRVVKKLLRSARQSVDLTTARYISEERLQRGSQYHLWEFLLEVEEARKLPKEFHPIDFQKLNPSSPEELRFIARILEEVAGRPNRTRDIRYGLGLAALKATDATLVP